MRMIAVLWVVLGSGCYAEVTTGAYKIDQSGGAIPAGEKLDPTAVAIGLNVGMHFDFWQKTRVAIGYGGVAASIPGDAGGKAGVSAGPLSVRLDQTLMRAGRPAVLAVTAAGAKGSGGASFTDMAGNKTEASGPSSLELYLGATIGLYGKEDPALVQWAFHLSGGLSYISNSSDMLGDVSMLGVQGRLTVSWWPGLIPGLVVIGKYSGGGSAGGENIVSFKVDMPGSDNVIGGLGRAMQATGCSIGVVENNAIGGVCSGTTIAIVQDGSQLQVACKGVSDATCRATFATILGNAR